MKPPEMDRLEVGIANFEDVILARQKIREMMKGIGFSLLDQTRVVTAVSELARNIVVHAKRGMMSAWPVSKNKMAGIRCQFKDEGPGIANVRQALTEGFSTTNSLGLGLSGARKLSAEFDIQTEVGKGTVVTITEWMKRY